ncbi:MAG: hypothetical protein NUV47_02395 [Patescibacteria group bacterium]|nr:hypothetical protein [Patescibacteria group bacterium]
MSSDNTVEEYYKILNLLQDSVGYHDVCIVSGNRRLYYDWKNSQKILDCKDKPAWIVVEKVKYKRFDKKIGEYDSLSLALKALIGE